MVRRAAPRRTRRRSQLLAGGMLDYYVPETGTAGVKLDGSTRVP